MIEMQCPRCKKVLEIGEQFAGQSGTCQHCGGLIQVPSSSTPLLVPARGPGQGKKLILAGALLALVAIGMAGAFYFGRAGSTPETTTPPQEELLVVAKLVPALDTEGQGRDFVSEPKPRPDANSRERFAEFVAAQLREIEELGEQNLEPQGAWREVDTSGEVPVLKGKGTHTKDASVGSGRREQFRAENKQKRLEAERRARIAGQRRAEEARKAITDRGLHKVLREERELWAAEEGNILPALSGPISRSTGPMSFSTRKVATRGGLVASSLSFSTGAGAGSSLSYAGSGGNHWLEEKSDDGSVLILGDGSIWQVQSLDRLNSAIWLPFSEITVTESSSGGLGFNHILVNMDDSETVHAKYVGNR